MGSSGGDDGTEVLGQGVGPLDLSAPSAVPGGEVSLRGSGCIAGETVGFFADGESVGQTVADGDGAFDATVVLPADLGIGEHQLEARCGGVTLDATIDIVITTTTGAASTSAGVVLAFFLLIALVFTQGRGSLPARQGIDASDDDLIDVR